MTTTAFHIPEIISLAMAGIQSRRNTTDMDPYRQLAIIRLSGVPINDAVLLYQTLTELNNKDKKVSDFLKICDTIGAMQVDGEVGFIKSPDTQLPFMLLICSDSIERYCVNIKLIYPSNLQAYKPIADSIRYQFGLNMLLTL
jgi:hypothetical protein